MDVVEHLKKAARSYKILVVDDDDYILDIFKKIDAEYACQVDICRTASDGIHKVETELYNIVFLDLKLGYGRTGMDVLRRIHELDLEVMVVLMSGSSLMDMETLVQANSIGAYGFLFKPIPFNSTHVTRILKRLGALLLTKDDLRQLDEVRKAADGHIEAESP